MGRSAGWVAALGLAGTVITGQAATPLQIDQAWNKGIAWMMLSQHGDGGWGTTLTDGIATRQGLGIQATAAAALALANMNLKGGYTYPGGVAWLANAEPASVDALASQVIALKTSGQDLAALGTKLTSARNHRNLWGAYPRYAGSVVDTALGLRAMLDVNSSYSQAGTAVCTLLSAQHQSGPDYGWSHALPTPGLPASQGTPTIAATAHAVLALKRWAGATDSVLCTSGGTSTSYSLASVYANAVSWLLTRKTQDNGFGDNGASGVLESALALRVLKEVAPFHAAIDTTIDYLIGQQGADGSWWGGEALQTAEVLLALSTASSGATQRPSSAVAVDSDKDGIPDGVEEVLGTDPAKPDSRFLADGAGLGVTQTAQRLAAAAIAGAPAASDLVSVRLDGSASTLATSWNRSADLEVFAAGTATQVPVLEAALAHLFGPGEMQVLLDDGGVRGALSGARYRSYYGTVTDSSLPELQGRRLLVHFSASGGSAAGVIALARGEALARMVIGPACVELDGSGRWSCPADGVVASVPEVGLSEVGPDWHAGQDGGLTEAELARLDTLPVNALAYGLAASNALRSAGLEGLPREQLARLVTGTVYDDWSAVQTSLPPKPIILCRLARGAQPAAEAMILGTGCRAGAPAAASAATSAEGLLEAPGYLIVERESPQEVAECLDRVDYGGTFQVNGTDVSVRPGGYAVAVLGLGTQPGSTDRWGYIATDGHVPDPQALAQGTYPYVTAAWMQWRQEPAAGQPPPAGATLALLQYLRHRMGDPGLLSGLLGYRPLTGTGDPATGPGDLTDVCRISASWGS